MKGIYQKELRHCFQTMKGYVFIAMFLAVSGVLFTMVNLLSQNSDIRTCFASLTTIAVFLLPILTMGLFAEERKQKTDELLLTAPVTLTAVVLGKFWATVTVFAIPLAVMGLYPVVLASYGAAAPMAAIGCLIGFLLLGMALIAIGLFLSMLTDSQFVAAMLTYALFALLVMAGGARGVVGWPLLDEALGFLAITSHYNSFTYGVFELKELVYYLSIAALFLFSGVYVLERRRLA